MWFVFPQFTGLGCSETARFYGIGSREEARAYLEDPLLGDRIRECAAALLTHKGASAEMVLGSIDALKLRSSMTLFEAVADDPAPFAAVLDAFFDGKRDALTLQLLSGYPRVD